MDDLSNGRRTGRGLHPVGMRHGPSRPLAVAAPRRRADHRRTALRAAASVRWERRFPPREHRESRRSRRRSPALRPWRPDRCSTSSGIGRCCVGRHDRRRRCRIGICGRGRHRLATTRARQRSAAPNAAALAVHAVVCPPRWLEPPENSAITTQERGQIQTILRYHGNIEVGRLEGQRALSLPVADLSHTSLRGLRSMAPRSRSAQPSARPSEPVTN